MKIKEKDLVIGDEYWFDVIGGSRGIFVGVFDDYVYFHPTSNLEYGEEPDGTIGFPCTEDIYEEVE